uniref:Uncharacterized protein n=1 Tax=Nelumbo nucifera TaxID=4432 RepID=A0A822ZM57_NELNU|nr:TPA_asm: hypothetical protein HUJ06_002841 [Nelumbo nucifera]
MERSDADSVENVEGTLLMLVMKTVGGCKLDQLSAKKILLACCNIKQLSMK